MRGGGAAVTPAETLVEIARLMATLPEELRTPWVNLNSSDAAVRMLAAAGGAQVTHYYDDGTAIDGCRLRIDGLEFCCQAPRREQTDAEREARAS